MPIAAAIMNTLRKSLYVTQIVQILTLAYSAIYTAFKHRDGLTNYYDTFKLFSSVKSRMKALDS